MGFVIISIVLLIVILVTIIAVLLSVSSKAEEEFFKLKEQDQKDYIEKDNIEDIHKKNEDK